jgi:hypothetical protein
MNSLACMKVILTILCVAMILFGGGCAVTLGSIGGGSAGFLGLIPVAIVALNVIVLIALYNGSSTLTIPLYFLAIFDFLVAIAVLVASLSIGGGVGKIVGFGVLIATTFAVKGFLTITVVQRRI